MLMRACLYETNTCPCLQPGAVLSSLQSVHIHLKHVDMTAAVGRAICFRDVSCIYWACSKGLIGGIKRNAKARKGYQSFGRRSGNPKP